MGILVAMLLTASTAAALAGYAFLFVMRPIEALALGAGALITLLLAKRAAKLLERSN